MADQKCNYVCGKAVGGTTILNGLIYVRGSKDDYNDWGKLNPGWAYKDVLPYFKKAENLIRKRTLSPIEPEYHGIGGPTSVETGLPTNPVDTLWLDANIEKGYKNIDINGKSIFGASSTQIMTKNGRRQDTGTTYIKPVLSRKNLNISTESYVTQILIDKHNKVTGVRFALNKQYYIAKVTKEVILSAGSIASPQILLNSGIGPKEHLSQIGIPLHKNLPVGSSLQNHIGYCGLYFTSNLPKSNKTLRNYVEEYLKNMNSLTIGSLGFYRPISSTSNSPKIEIMLLANNHFAQVQESLANAKQQTWKSLKPEGFNPFVLAQKVKSVGTIRLKNKDFFEYPLIDSNYFSGAGKIDMETLYEGIQIALDIVLNTTIFQKINAILVKQDLPECDKFVYLSKDYWMCAIKYFSCDTYHPMRTCPMHRDSTKGVVDKDCKVHGVEKLRVVDASIYPLVLSGHPHAQCLMIGEKLSDVIKKHYNA